MDIVEMLLALMIFGIPCGALAVRFIMRPALREIVQAINQSKGAVPEELERRLAELEEGQQQMVERLDHLIEAERFRAQLESDTGAGKRP
jgi:hypothetical protein